MAKLSQKILQTQKLTPQQILNVNIIQLNSNFIEKRILDELENNPALGVNVDEEDPYEDEADEESARRPSEGLGCGCRDGDRLCRPNH